MNELVIDEDGEVLFERKRIERKCKGLRKLRSTNENIRN